VSPVRPPELSVPGEIAIAQQLEIEASHDVAARAPTVAPSMPAPAAPPVKHWESFRSWTIRAAVCGWALGSFICLVVVTVRIGRFATYLRYGEVAPPALQSRARALAERMQIPDAPLVWFVPGVVCPMLWTGLGLGSRLLVPRGLWDRLDAAQQSSLLAHELAHLKRRDHWVRVLEVLATVLYWWFPVMWWARGRLREAEEQCCDAWVVWALPGLGRDYAGALLEALEFIAEGERGGSVWPAAPMLASGMGQFHQLSRRLTMIKSEAVPRKLSWLGRAVVCGLAVGWLPLAPAGAQVTPVDKANEPAVGVAAPPVVEVPPIQVAPPAALTPAEAPALSVPSPVALDTKLPALEPVNAPADDDDDDRDEAAKKEFKRNKPEAYGEWKPGQPDPKMMREIESARARVKDISLQLQVAQKRLMELEAQLSGHRISVKVTRDGVQKSIELDAKTGKVVEEKIVGKGPTEPYSSKTPAAVAPQKPGAYATPPAPERPTTPYFPKGSDGKPGMSREQRLAELESNLRALLDEVRALKAEDRHRSESDRGLKK
jgi:beta-lactamase regulating signal transducer with metallopeptidase domain